MSVTVGTAVELVVAEGGAVTTGHKKRPVSGASKRVVIAAAATAAAAVAAGVAVAVAGAGAVNLPSLPTPFTHDLSVRLIQILEFLSRLRTTSQR